MAMSDDIFHTLLNINQTSWSEINTCSCYDWCDGGMYMYAGHVLRIYTSIMSYLKGHSEILYGELIEIIDF